MKRVLMLATIATLLMFVPMRLLAQDNISSPRENILTTDIILAYPGAISPFAIRKGGEVDYDKALSLYSTLCAYLNPKTEYLAGNIVLCLLNGVGIDSWSQQQIKSLE